MINSWLGDSYIPLAVMLIVMSHIALLSKLLHGSNIFEAVPLRDYGTRVILRWISLIVLWLWSSVSLWALTSGWLCCQLGIARATWMLFHCVIADRGYAVIAILSDKRLSYWLVGVPIHTIRRTVVDTLVSSLWGCFELSEIGWLSTYLGHFDFISTSVGRTNG